MPVMAVKGMIKSIIFEPYSKTNPNEKTYIYKLFCCCF